MKLIFDHNKVSHEKLWTELISESGAEAEIIKIETSELVEYAKKLRRKSREDHKS